MTNYATQQQNDDMMSLIAAQFRLLYNPTHAFADAVAMLQMFPGIVGLWSHGAFGGGTRDKIVDTINGLDLTPNGNVNIQVMDLAPTSSYDGSTSYWSHTDTTDLDISGTESRLNSLYQGYTAGGWFRFRNIATADEYCMSKTGTYYFRRLSTGKIRSVVVDSTPTFHSSDSAETIGANTWVFLCARLQPSVAHSIFVNGNENRNTSSVIASIRNTANSFFIGYEGTTGFMNGFSTLNFLCAAAVPNIFINTFYQMTAPLFNVSI